MERIRIAHDIPAPVGRVGDRQAHGLVHLGGAAVREQVDAVDVPDEAEPVAAVLLYLFELHACLGFERIEPVVAGFEYDIEQGPEVPSLWVTALRPFKWAFSTSSML